MQFSSSNTISKIASVSFIAIGTIFIFFNIIFSMIILFFLMAFTIFLLVFLLNPLLLKQIFPTRFSAFLCPTLTENNEPLYINLLVGFWVYKRYKWRI